MLCYQRFFAARIVDGPKSCKLCQAIVCRQLLCICQGMICLCSWGVSVRKFHKITAAVINIVRCIWHAVCHACGTLTCHMSNYIACWHQPPKLWGVEKRLCMVHIQSRNTDSCKPDPGHKGLTSPPTSQSKGTTADLNKGSACCCCQQHTAHRYTNIRQTLKTCIPHRHLHSNARRHQSDIALAPARTLAGITCWHQGHSARDVQHRNARRALLTGIRATLHRQHHTDARRASLTGTRARMQRQQCTHAHELLTGIRVMLPRQPYTDMHQAFLNSTRATLQRQQHTDTCKVSLIGITAALQRQRACNHHTLPQQPCCRSRKSRAHA